MDWGLFVAKKVVSVLFYPVGTTLALLASGILIWFWKPRSRLGIVFICTGTLWLFISSLGITGSILAEPLEKAAGSYADPKELAAQHVEYIVVLGSGIRTNPVEPLGLTDCSSFSRVIEGIRLWKAIPGSKLVVSGGGLSSEGMTSGEAMAAVAGKMGVPPGDIVRETRSLDTMDEAGLLKPLLGNSRFALVTSALHMSRSLKIFKSLGMNPVPAPADFHAEDHRKGLRAFLPGEMGIRLSQWAIHEYVGMLRLRLGDLL
ncbi:MAG: ElyC/SanA/YdcF family protein [Pseudomonadota bacterium]